MRGPRLFALVASTILAGGTACSLLVDTDGLAGGAGSADAAPSPSSSGQPVEGGALLEAGLAEAAPPDAPDAAREGGGDGVLFSDSFDDGSADPARWDEIELGAGMQLDLDSEALSPPRALRLRLQSGGGSRVTLIGKRVALVGDGRGDVDVDFAVRLQHPSTSDFGSLEYVAIAVEPPPPGKTGRFVSLLQINGGPLELATYVIPEDSAAERAVDVNPPILFDTWVRVSLQIRGGATPKARAYFDGMLVGTVDLAGGTPTAVVLRLGLDTAEANTAMTVRFDDVRVRQR